MSTGASLPYRKALIIGATSGIGAALAERFVQASISTVVVGRRQENLDKFVSAHSGSGAAVSAIPLDITSLASIPSFAARIAREHPDLDFVLINSGIQRNFDFSKPETVDLDVLATEVTTNYTSYIHLALALLPQLQARSKEGGGGGGSGDHQTCLAFTSSGLALLPLLPCGNYCATKAALHHWILVLREQLKPAHPLLKVVEMLPPAVQTELHGAGGASFGMPLKDWTDFAWGSLAAGKEEFTCGPAESAYKDGGFEVQRQGAMKGMNGWLYPEGWKGLSQH